MSRAADGFTQIRLGVSLGLASVFLISSPGVPRTLMAESTESTPLFRFAEAAGAHAVGLKIVNQYDYSRVYCPTADELGKAYQGERARPIQTLIWYPAQKSSGTKMTVGDYVHLVSTEAGYDVEARAEQEKSLRKDLAPVLQDPLWAVRDAPIQGGHFPVVIYAPSYGNESWENADLCEYLASNGYVVIASPSMGTSTRLMEGSVTGVHSQARDIEFLIAYAQTLPDADMSEIAVAGFSFGGISNLFAAARDSRIKALVALDGSMRYFPDLIKEAGDVHPERMGIPLLFFASQELRWLEDMEPTPAGEKTLPHPLNQWTHGDLITVHMLGMIHNGFASMFQRPGGTFNREAGDTLEDSIVGYQWVARYTLNFLNGYLKHDADAMAFLKKTPAENDVPRHVMIANFHAAQGPPATLEAFREEAGHEGFERASQMYVVMHKKDPDFKFDEGTALILWAHDLIDRGYSTEALSLTKVYEAMEPNSGEAYYLSGLAYEKSGNRQLAMEKYRKAVETGNGPTDKAQARLKDLDSSSATSQ